MLDLYTTQNPHWKKKELFKYPLKRKIFEKLKTELTSHKLILSIEGPRRVGKSILIKQLINHLLEKEVKPKNIFYFSFDKIDKKIFDIINDYEKISGVSLDEEKIYFFFDEIQKIKDWQSDIKIIYDNYPNIKIVVSGSTLRASKKESLAGRMYDFFINPLSFEEYLLFSNKQQLLDADVDLVLEKEYQNYLFKQYPEIVLDKNINPRQYINLIIQKIIYEDSEKYITNVDKDILYKICMIIFKDPGQIIDYTDLSKELGIKRNVVSEYVSFLINSGIVRKIYNFSTNARKQEIKAKKFYPFCTSLTRVVTENPNMSKIIETDVGFQLNAKYFLNNKGKEEIDFIIYDEIKETKIGVEVKYKNRITNSDVKNFNSAIVKKIKLNKKIIVVKTQSKLEYNDQKIKPFTYYTLFKYKKKILTI